MEVRLDPKVVDADARGLVVETPQGERRRQPPVVKVWAAEVAASPLGRMLSDRSEAEVDRAGEVIVEPDLTLPGHPEVYVVGDTMALDKLPGVAQVAIQGGEHAAKNMVARTTGAERPGAFRYVDTGSMATISRFGAIAKIGKGEFSGFIAWLLWLFVHLLCIAGFKSRVTTPFHWAVSFFGKGRPQRTSTERMLIGRLAVERLGAHLDERLVPPSDMEKFKDTPRGI